MSRNRYPGVYKRGATWSFRQQFGDGSDRHGLSGSGYPSAKAAHDAKLEAIRKARPMQGVTQRPDAKLTLAGYMSVWAEDHSRTLRPSTASTYRSRARLVSKSPVAQKRLRSLTESDYRRLIEDLRAQSPSHTNLKSKITTLKVALDAAVRAGLIPNHPLRDIKVTRTAGQRFEPGVWTALEARKFLAHRRAAGDPLHLCYHLAINTGLRRGELHGLRREDLDLDGGLLHVRRQRVDVDGVIHEGPVKTDGSEAPVYLDPATVALLRQHTWTCEYLVTDARTGQPYTDIRRFARTFKASVRSANVPEIRFHDLRHTTASLMADAGVPLVLAQQRMRHWSSAMTARYTHALENRAPEVADILGKMLEEPAA